MVKKQKGKMSSSLPEGLSVLISPESLLPQESFLRMLRLEQRRSERSKTHFVLMLIAAAEPVPEADRRDVLGKAVKAIARTTRETDIWGWYQNNLEVGVIFTEARLAERPLLANVLKSKVARALSASLPLEEIRRIQVSFHAFPESGELPGPPPNPALYPDTRSDSRKGSLMIKRAIDIVGSATLLIVLSPLMAAIAIAVKLTSPGQILFRQERVGRQGRKFTFLKFRSMRSGSSTAIHQEYVTKLIKGSEDAASNGDGVYKIKDDPRVTPLGRFLRKTSLDELPQLFNVLSGEMSLVGPRPAIPYEVASYDVWHRRRFLEVKPGITGLWQVTGRSRTKFDDMVRLDLRYAISWSLWMDAKILLQTPRAVIGGSGAH
jgi:lipopolysaccharide/colanic/teichoic acid biosynthesis glycosyltransferase